MNDSDTVHAVIDVAAAAAIRLSATKSSRFCNPSRIFDVAAYHKSLSPAVRRSRSARAVARSAAGAKAARAAHVPIRCAVTDAEEGNSYPSGQSLKGGRGQFPLCGARRPAVGLRC